MTALQRAVPVAALCLVLTIAGFLIAPTVRARWFADPEPVQLIVVVGDNTRETRPLEMVVHVPAEDPWHVTVTPDMPIDARFFGFYQVGEVHNMWFEILGDHGVVLEVEFRMTEDMEPVDTRNRVEIDVRDDEVLVRGLPTTRGSFSANR